jgi:hypothetical protein
VESPGGPCRPWPTMAVIGRLGNRNICFLIMISIYIGSVLEILWHGRTGATILPVVPIHQAPAVLRDVSNTPIVPASASHGVKYTMDSTNSTAGLQSFDNWTTAEPTGEHVPMVTAGAVRRSDDLVLSDKATNLPATSDPIATLETRMQEWTIALKTSNNPSILNDTIHVAQALLQKLKAAVDILPKPISAQEPNDVMQAVKSSLVPMQGKAIAHPAAIARALLWITKHHDEKAGVVHVCGYPSGMILACALFPERTVQRYGRTPATDSDIMVVGGRCKVKGFPGTILYW